MWESPIQWLIALGAWFSDHIKAVTAIYDPSLGQQQGDQSGKAIEQLRSESSVGTFSYADNLHRAIEIMYDQMVKIFPKIMNGPQVVTIVKPDSQHEVIRINQEFGDGGIDPATGRKGKANNIGVGRFSVRVIAGPSFETRQDQAIQSLNQFFQAAPQTLGVPGVAARYLRMIGQGNPQVEGMADLLQPTDSQEATPAQLSQQLQQAQQQGQAQQVLIQKMQQALAAKLPEVEAGKWKAAIESLTKIRVAEINASKDLDKANADRMADAMEHLTGMAHDVAMQAHAQDAAATAQASDQAHAMASQANDQAAAAQQQQQPQQQDEGQ
jgi:hypothetical protein